MSKQAFTPGPWQVKETRSQSGSALKCIERAKPAKGGINGLIAIMPDRTPSAAQWEPNARLIAAAPEMLEALKMVLSVGKSLNVDGLKLIENVIAKATGGAE